MRSFRRPALGARLRPGTVALAVLLTLSTAGCINRGREPEAATTGGAPSPELGAAPTDLGPAATTPLPDATASAVGGASTRSAAGTTVPRASGGSTAPVPTSSTAGDRASTTTAATAPERAVVVSSQRDGGDVLGGPGYADLRALVVERIGTKLRVTVEVADAVPANLAPREVIGLGVDFSRPGALESEAQLFVDGGEDGWRAYLQRNDGFVEYPGTFALGGNRLVFEVPESSIPHPLPSSISAFLDWSTKSPAPRDSSDAMPDAGPLKPTP